VIELPAGTNEKLGARVRLDGDRQDPRPYAASFALVDPDATPVSGDWVTATWESSGPPYRAYAQFTRSAGTYRLWLRLSGSGETVLRKVEIVEFT
jgi:hypothetical protein